MAQKKEKRPPNLILVFDVETTGLTQNRGWEPKIGYRTRTVRDDDGNTTTREVEVVKEPRIVQLGWVTIDAEGNISDPVVRTVRPDGWRVPSEAASIHGITTQRAKAEGLPIQDVLADFSAVAEQAEYIAGHNLRFDYLIVAGEYLRLGLPSPLKGKPYYCTMEETTALCKLPSWRGDDWKYPTLGQLYRFLFGKNRRGAHDAGADAWTCAVCLRELMQGGHANLMLGGKVPLAGLGVSPGGCVIPTVIGMAAVAAVAALTSYILLG